MLSEKTMSRTMPKGRIGATNRCADEDLRRLLKNHFEAEEQLRRGICLLVAGRYEAAEAAFARALRRGSTERSLPSLLAASLVGRGKPHQAARRLDEPLRQHDGSTATRVRHALSLWAAGKHEDAIASLREGIRQDRESAELHFQLGTLQASMEQFGEAELRFVQALNIDRDHTDARVSLALCCGARHAPADALVHLEQAQAKRPYDARIGLQLAQAAKAARQQGTAASVRARMPETEATTDLRGIEDLSRVIESEPDFVDAFLSIPVGDVDRGVFAMLLATLEMALERQPEQAELHYHCGRVLDRLGNAQDAIRANERAVQIDPTFVRALIELGRLYGRTDRADDARTRLEEAIEAGAEYADVYLLLGNLYRDQGEIGQARRAYGRALTLNTRYAEVIEALESLPV